MGDQKTKHQQGPVKPVVTEGNQAHIKGTWEIPTNETNLVANWKL